MMIIQRKIKRFVNACLLIITSMLKSVIRYKITQQILFKKMSLTLSANLGFTRDFTKVTIHSAACGSPIACIPEILYGNMVVMTPITVATICGVIFFICENLTFLQSAMKTTLPFLI